MILKEKRFIIAFFVIVLCLSGTSCITAGAGKSDSGEAVAKNIILMVPDGMGLSDVTAARNYLSGEDGEGLSFEKFPQIGYQRTYAANSTVTDSAAAASAWATGQKHDLSQISWRNGVPIQTILEIARKKNKSAGLVATSTITHATPAAFGAHVKNRGMQDEIARQYVEETGVEVLLGGGRKHFESLIDASQKKYGYIYVDKTKDLEAVSKTDADKVLGLFSEDGKTQEKFRIDPDSEYPDGEPTLAEMTSCALDILQKDNDGFFLLVEGSQVDWANHGNDYDAQLSEMLGFNEAVKEVCKWIEEKSGRGAETLVIVVADHDTGGFAINGPKGKIAGKGSKAEAGWTTKGHTAVDTVIWSMGPGSEKLGCALNNTDLFGVMKSVME